MFREQISNFWMQLSLRMTAAWSTAPRGQLETASAILDEDLMDPVNAERSAEPYVPSKNERLSESSQHFSC
jgi:hypothetical protein